MKIKDDFLIYIFVFICVFCLFFNTFFGSKKTTLAQDNSSFIVYDPSLKTVISGENIHSEMEPASTTKIVTLIVALQNIDDLERYVNISNKAEGVEGSSIFLKAGQQWKIIDLLYGMMLRSGNDAATQIALTTCGSVENFVDKMNALSLSLGLKNTSFKNPTGLPCVGHFTSAYDLAVLTAYGYEKYPLFSEIVSCKYHKTSPVKDGETETVFTFKNKNKLLFSFDGACGVKTGYTKRAGRCFVGCTKRQNLSLIYVCLNKYDMWEHCVSETEKAFSSYQKIKLAEKGNTAGYVFCDETKEYIPLYFQSDLVLYLKEFNMDKLSYVIEKSQSESKNDKNFQYIRGNLKVYYDNGLIFICPLCNNINKYYKE